jgi:hypothetical protein
VATPILDYVSRLDYRNLDHRLEAAPPDLLKTARWWSPGVTLDQGVRDDERARYDGGGCVGHGIVGDYLASPVRGRYGAEDGHDAAVDVYNAAKRVDEFEGVNYEGTSVRAGMLVARSKKWITGFKWALSTTELRTGLESGPVVIGFVFTEGLWETQPNGDWIPGGDEVGGHCVLVTGYSPNYHGRGPRYRIKNSWNGWGYQNLGNAYLSPDSLNTILFDVGGEAAVAQGRHL